MPVQVVWHVRLVCDVTIGGPSEAGAAIVPPRTKTLDHGAVVLEEPSGPTARDSIPRAEVRPQVVLWPRLRMRWNVGDAPLRLSEGASQALPRLSAEAFLSVQL